jgi:hypothetical protein
VSIGVGGGGRPGVTAGSAAERVAEERPRFVVVAPSVASGCTAVSTRRVAGRGAAAGALPATTGTAAALSSPLTGAVAMGRVGAVVGADAG